MRVSRSGMATGVLVVAALFVGSTINDRFPDPNALYAAPFEHRGGLGDLVELRDARVRVTGVRAGKELERFGEVAATSGAFLVVDLVFEPRGETNSLPPGLMRLRTPDGRLFGGSGPLVTGCGPTQPGVPVACAAPFELPPDALAGATLLIPNRAHIDAMDDLAVVDLGITEEQADELFDASGRVELPDQPLYVER